MTLLEPDVFYSDILLAVTLCSAGWFISSQHKVMSGGFYTLAASTFFGAWYHGLYNTTGVLPGEMLWSLTMILYGLSSFIFIQAALPRLMNLPGTLICTGLFALFTTTINESFHFGLWLQGVAILCIGHFVLRNGIRSSMWVYMLFVLITFFSILIQQQQLNFGLPYSHNTIFHLIQIPAIGLLYLCLKTTPNRRLTTIQYI